MHGDMRSVAGGWIGDPWGRGGSQALQFRHMCGGNCPMNSHHKYLIPLSTIENASLALWQDEERNIPPSMDKGRKGMRRSKHLRDSLGRVKHQV